MQSGSVVQVDDGTRVSHRSLPSYHSLDDGRVGPVPDFVEVRDELVPPYHERRQQVDEIERGSMLLHPRFGQALKTRTLLAWYACMAKWNGPSSSGLRSVDLIASSGGGPTRVAKEYVAMEEAVMTTRLIESVLAAETSIPIVPFSAGWMMVSS